MAEKMAPSYSTRAQILFRPGLKRSCRATRCQCYKRFFLSPTLRTNKLGCLSVASFFGLVKVFAERLCSKLVHLSKPGKVTDTTLLHNVSIFRILRRRMFYSTGPWDGIYKLLLQFCGNFEDRGALATKSKALKPGSLLY